MTKRNQREILIGRGVNNDLNIRDIEIALGDGIKKLYDSEMGARKKLRRVKS